MDRDVRAKVDDLLSKAADQEGGSLRLYLVQDGGERAVDKSALEPVSRMWGWLEGAVAHHRPEDPDARFRLRLLDAGGRGAGSAMFRPTDLDETTADEDGPLSQEDPADDRDALDLEAPAWDEARPSRLARGVPPPLARRWHDDRRDPGDETAAEEGDPASEERLSEAVERAEEAEADLERATRKIEDLEDALQDATQRAAEAEADLKEERRRSHEADAKRREAEQRARAAETRAADTAKTRASNDRELADLRRRAREAEASAREAERKVGRAERAVEDARTRAEDAERQLRAMEETLRAAERRASQGGGTSLRRLEDALEEANEARREAVERAERAEGELRALRLGGRGSGGWEDGGGREGTSRVRALERENAALRDERDRLKEKLSEARETIEEMERQGEAINRGLTVLQGQMGVVDEDDDEEESRHRRRRRH